MREESNLFKDKENDKLILGKGKVVSKRKEILELLRLVYFDEEFKGSYWDYWYCIFATCLEYSSIEYKVMYGRNCSICSVREECKINATLDYLR